MFHITPWRNSVFWGKDIGKKHVLVRVLLEINVTMKKVNDESLMKGLLERE